MIIGSNFGQYLIGDNFYLLILQVNAVVSSPLKKAMTPSQFELLTKKGEGVSKWYKDLFICGYDFLLLTNYSSTFRTVFVTLKQTLTLI